MLDKKRWIYNFKKLYPESQIEIAQIIINELKDNEIAFNKADYDKEKSIMIRDLFEELISQIEDREDFKRLSIISRGFDSLSQENKDRVIASLYESISICLGMQEQERNELLCKEEGHQFDEWIHRKWITFGDKMVNHELVHNYPIDNESWERRCTRCGHRNVVYEEPQDIIDARNERNKQIYAKKMERRKRKKN